MSLAERDQRRAFLREVWGSETWQRQILKALRIVGLEDGVVGDDVFAYVRFLFRCMGYVADRAFLPLTRWMLLRPAGARTVPTAPLHTTVVDGTVRSIGELEPSPGTGRPCVAFSITLCARRVGAGTAVVCRQAATIGFELVADDGTALRFPAGRILFHPLPGAGSRLDRGIARAHAEDLFRHCARMSEEELPMVPADTGWEEILVPGDRVRVGGHFEAREDTTRGRELSRSPARVVLVAVGLASVEKLGIVRAPPNETRTATPV